MHCRYSHLQIAVLGALCIAILPHVVRCQPTVGLTAYEPDSTYDGYTLFSPFASDTTYLVDMWGRVVHAWSTNTNGGFNHAYLLEDGSLLKGQDGSGSSTIGAPGQSAYVKKYSWDNTLLWHFSYISDAARAHHDVEPMPNGNVLVIAWENKTADEWEAAGGNPALLDTNFVWPDHIVEVQPTGATTGDIVWEWHMWDHLIQDFDATKPNYGVVADNPQRIDINSISLGIGDWAHTNGVDYNPQLDQIALSTPTFNELWVIDHSTTTAEAAGSSGGNSGMGGDLLYRWGNPRMYDRGTGADQKLFFQHDVRWIAPGNPGAGNLLLFNNRIPGGPAGPAGDYSTVDELVPPDSGWLYKVPAPTFLPADFIWSYQAEPDPTTFNGRALSGAQRLPNGNTLVCNGALGDLFEVTRAGNVVWRYKSPVTDAGTVSQGTTVADFSSLLFKCDRYPYEHPAFAGRDLQARSTIEAGTAQTAWTSLPADSAVLVSTTPTFEWQAAANASTYHLQVSSTKQFVAGDLVVDVDGLTGTSYTVVGKTLAALPLGTYRWRVQSSSATFGDGPMSNIAIFSTNDEIALPVELVSFEATVDGADEVELYWETASETNCAGFGVEHEMDLAASGGFEEIAFVEGAGTTTDRQLYRISIGDLEPGRHRFRLRQIDTDGTSALYGPVLVEVEAPTVLWLATPYPNPFNPATRVRFSVSTPGQVELNVYDILGHRVETLFAGQLSDGKVHEAVFDGSGLASGVYMLRLESESGQIVSRHALLSK